MRVRTTTAAAPGRPENEDAVFVAGDLVGVLDGVTAPEGIDTGCVHTVAWYVQRLVERVTQVHTGRPEQPLTRTLATAIEFVRADHGSTCDLDQPATPAATVALLRRRDSVLDYLVLSDATIVFDKHTGIDVITDTRFEEAMADIRARVFGDKPVLDSADHRERVRWSNVEKQKLVNRDGGYWIAAATPAAADHAITGTAELDGPAAVHRAVLMTDGVANLVDPFGELDWPALVELADASPNRVIEAVREAENRDPEGKQTPRYKRHDDATLAVCTFDGSA